MLKPLYIHTAPD